MPREARERKPVKYAESTPSDGKCDSSDDEPQGDSGSENEDSDDQDEDDSLSDDSGGNEDEDQPPKKKSKIVVPASKAAKSVPKVAPKSVPGDRAVSKTTQENKSVSLKAQATVSNPAVPTSSWVGGVDITQGPPVSTDAAAKKLIMQYLRQQNRPYGALQIHDNLHKRVPKATVERVLTAMASEGLLCKEYGKAKIYFLDQSQLPAERSQSELEAVQASVTRAQSELQSLQQQEKERRVLLSSLLNAPDDAHLHSHRAEVAARLQTKREKAARLAAPSGPTGAKRAPQTLASAVVQFNRARNSWQERRSLCLNALDLLCDATGQKRKHWLDLLELETDEAAAQTLPPRMT